MTKDAVTGGLPRGTAVAMGYKSFAKPSMEALEAELGTKCPDLRWRLDECWKKHFTLESVSDTATESLVKDENRSPYAQPYHPPY